MARGAERPSDTVTAVPMCHQSVPGPSSRSRLAIIALVRSGPRDVPRILVLSRASYRKDDPEPEAGSWYNVGEAPLAAGALGHKAFCSNRRLRRS